MAFVEGAYVEECECFVVFVEYGGWGLFLGDFAEYAVGVVCGVGCHLFVFCCCCFLAFCFFVWLWWVLRSLVLGLFFGLCFCVGLLFGLVLDVILR